jgi:tRNA A37 methylthiotransferase MiaB
MEELLSLDIKLQEEYYQKFIGTKHKVIIEDLHGDYYLAHTSNYLPVMIPYDERK